MEVKGSEAQGRHREVGSEGSVETIFDLKTLKTLGTVKAGTNPDAIIYDPHTKRVFTMNGRSQDTTAINAADGTVAGTLALGGKPEFAVADGHGNIFVNIRARTRFADAATFSQRSNRWAGQFDGAITNFHAHDSLFPAAREAGAGVGHGIPSSFCQR